MSKASGISYTEQDKIATYFQVHYFPSHLMNVGGEGQKLG